MIKILVLPLMSLVTLAILSGCSTKKVQTDEPSPSASAIPAISSEALNFDPQGSDSQKIEGLSSVHFEYNKSTLDKNEKQILEKNAEWLKAHKTLSVQIEGHCDMKGSIEYNLSLGERRAKTAYDYLINLGVDAKQLSTISYGKEKPLSTEDSDEAQAKNRRDNFVPTPK